MEQISCGWCGAAEHKEIEIIVNGIKIRITNLCKKCGEKTKNDGGKKDEDKNEKN